MSRDLTALIDEPCRCEPCGACFGRGTIRTTVDDLWELETCEECSGYGVVIVCDRCQLLEESDYEE